MTNLKIFVLFLLILSLASTVFAQENQKTDADCNEDAQARCRLPLVTGMCRGYFPKYGYSVEEKKCVEFVYGGCPGNDNRFDSKQECIDACE